MNFTSLSYMHESDASESMTCTFPHNYSIATSAYMTTEVLIPLEDETAILGGEGHFLCQLQGNEQRLRIGGTLISIPYYYPNDLNIVATDVSTPTENPLNINNITIAITALVKYNNTEVECYDRTMGRGNASKAILTIQGIPQLLFIDFVCVARLELCALNNIIRLLLWSQYTS